MYCTYEQYIEKGGSMTSKDFEVWGFRASRMIDAVTMGRAKKYAEFVQDELADACARIADIMKQNSECQAKSLNLASSSTDGYSESYISAEAAERNVKRSIYSALSEPLGDDRYNLLYAGVCL